MRRSTSEPATPGVSTSAADSTASGAEDRRAQPAAPTILHPQDSAKSHKKRTWTQHERAGREGATQHAAGSTAGLPDQITASGYGHLTRPRPQDSASNSGHRHQEPRKPLAGRGLTDLCGAMSAGVPALWDVLGPPGNQTLTPAR